MGGEFFTDFKFSNRIEISWLVQALLNFYWFWGSTPLGDGGWVHGGGGGGGYGCVGGVSHAHTHAHTCTHMHARMHMHVKHANHAKHGCLHVGGHLQFLYVCVCACACMRMHVHVWGDTPLCPQMPLTPPHPTAPSPELQGAQNSKIQ